MDVNDFEEDQDDILPEFYEQDSDSQFEETQQEEEDQVEKFDEQFSDSL